MTALELKTLASGLPTQAQCRSELEASFLEDGVTTLQSGDEGARSQAQESFSREDLLDEKGKSKIEQELRDLEMEIANRLAIGEGDRRDREHRRLTQTGESTRSTGEVERGLALCLRCISLGAV